MVGDGMFFVMDLAKTVSGIFDQDFKDWDSILEWKLSKMECPKDTDPRVPSLPFDDLPAFPATDLRLCFCSCGTLCMRGCRK